MFSSQHAFKKLISNEFTNQSIKSILKKTTMNQVNSQHSKRTMVSSDYKKFREILRNSKHVVALTGAGISAESGVPTFRGSGGLWRKYRSQQLATPEAFTSNPALVWQFYAYRRDLVLSKQPNPAHYSLASLEEEIRIRNNGKLTVITQNIDELHRVAGTKNLIELHGTLFKTRCTRCGDININREEGRKLCEGLAKVNYANCDFNATEDVEIELDELPKCQKSKCNGLLRPHVVWFGESLEPGILEQCQKELKNCDLCLVIGTSSIVYPAAMFAPQVAMRGKPVAEFNIEPEPSSFEFGFHFQGSCATTLPRALKFDD